MKIQIETILVPTDFSDNAAVAYPYAEILAKRFAARILMVHVADVPYYPVGPGQFAIGWERLEIDLMENVQREFERIRPTFGDDIEVETLMREGPPFLEIVRLANERDASLIVMSTHGHTGIKHLLMGSTAEKVVRKASCPVLTMHPGERSFVLP